MAEFNKSGVPWYAHPDTPAIRGPREIPDGNGGYNVNYMRALTYVRNFIRANWKEGDRFQFMVQSEDEDRPGLHSGKTGTFVKLALRGNSWRVIVKWDDIGYKPHTGSASDMFSFFQCAFKPETETQIEAPNES